ncbi:MAG: transposase [Bacteroidia bacterium]|nr:transposase [Bacteroidia bacterium]
MRVITTIDTILSKMPDLNKARRKFIGHCLLMFLRIGVRINFLSLARHSANYVESSYRNHFEDYFDFSTFNTELVLGTGSGHYVIGLDMTYIRKSGKETQGVGKYWSGCSGKAEWGLEAGILAAIDVDHHSAFHIDAVQSPDKAERTAAGFSYMDHCVCLVVWNQRNLKRLSDYLVVDAYFTKKEFIHPVVEKTGLGVIGRLRNDADLRYLYEGVQKSGKGRPKQYDGKVNWQSPQMQRFRLVYKGEDLSIYEAKLYCIFLRRCLKIAYVRFHHKTGKQAYKIYFSTDLHLPAWQITRYYQARFQEEFLIRDAKQFTGLQHCQARSRAKTEFHWNMSLTTVNLAKVEHWIKIPKEERKSFSMKDVKIRYYNELLLDTFFDNLPNGDELKKNNPQMKQLYSFGARDA